MDSTEDFCFEVPIINMENYRNLVEIEIETQATDTLTNMRNVQDHCPNSIDIVCNVNKIKGKNKQSTNIENENVNNKSTVIAKTTSINSTSVNADKNCSQSTYLTTSILPIIHENTNRELVCNGVEEISASSLQKHNTNGPNIVGQIVSPARIESQESEQFSTFEHQHTAEETSSDNCTVMIVNEDTNKQLTNLVQECLTPNSKDKNLNKHLLDLVDKCLNEASPIDKKGVNHQITNNGKKPHNAKSTVIDADTNKELTNHEENCIDKSTPIVIDEDSEKDNDCSIIDSDAMNPQKKQTFKDVNCFDKLYKENSFFTDIIEKCLEMENPKGMLRIINRTLIPMYYDADEKYKKSTSFQRTLLYTARKIDTEPNRKFLHIKNLFETMKQNKAKKRASFTTLTSNLNGKFSKNKGKFSVEEIPTKRKKVDVINVDDDDIVQISCNDVTNIQITDIRSCVTDDALLSVHKDKDKAAQIEIIDSDNDHESNRHNAVHGKDQDDDVILVEHEINCNKENQDVEKKSKPVRSESESNKQLCNKPLDNCNNEITSIDLSDETDEIDSNKVFNPGEPSDHKTDISHKDNIKILEDQIAVFHKKIKELEEKEVNVDNFHSPYMICEMYKKNIVGLYKKLCTLTGSESVKCHKVRLKVAEGHPEGPVKCLEEFINNNIDANGNPPFPDVHDVTDCVVKANELYKLGWGKKEIERQARSLFIQYGRTVQKRRMKREWRHLLTYIKEETPDPADEDLTLQTRLQQNSLIAKKNEEELLDRYAEMEKTSLNPDLRLSMDSDDSEQGSDINLNTSLPSSASNVPSEPIEANNCGLLNMNSVSTNNLIVYPYTTPVPYAMTYVVGYVNNVAPPMAVLGPTVIATTTAHTEQSNLETSRSKPDTQPNYEENIRNEVSTSNAAMNGMNVTLAPDNNTKVVERESSEVDSTVTVCRVYSHVTQNNGISNNTEAVKNTSTCETGSTDAGSSEISVKNTLIKTEPLDIPAMLEQLGDNYTATIIDIEDPFLVIEISDSSDSEDDEML